MLPSHIFRISLRRNHPMILLYARKYSTKKRPEDFSQASAPQHLTDLYKAIIEESKGQDEYVRDPLDFRSVGVYAGKQKNQKYDFKLISKNNVLYGTKARTIGLTLKNIMLNSKRKDQAYNVERVDCLGPDLAAAHFITCRGGAIKLVGENKFIRTEMNKSHEVLPVEKDPNYKIEAIDFSQTDFIYEAIGNLADLKYLSWVSFKNCLYVDNWILDHLSAVAPTIEFLDISGCTKVDHYGLSCFYRFKKLKCVAVEGTNDTDAFKLACLTLETEIPDLVFIGLKLKPTPKSVFDS